ncbi:MAG: hypothetical protein Q4F53_10090 [Nesterenkonia sp.]|nr:hypothetical protein [Nesterenkonia sp.]
MRTPGLQDDDHGSFALVTGDLALSDEIAVLAAVVGGRLRLFARWDEVPAVDPAGRTWAAVLCGPDAPPVGGPTPVSAVSSAVAGAAPTPILMVGLGDAARGQLWSAAAEGSDVTAVPLPEGETWLREHLGVRLTDQMPGRAAAFLGACGGAGTTTTAYLTAAEAAAWGLRTLLLDADPAPGGGLRAALEPTGAVRGRGSSGAPSARGPRTGRLTWDDLGAAEGDISAAQLQTAAVPLDGFGLITGGAEAPAASTVEAVLMAARRAADVVVVDLGRRRDLIGLGRGRWDLGVLVASPDRRGVQGAGGLAERLDAGVWRTAVCGGGRREPPPKGLAAHSGLEVVAVLPELRWLRRAECLRDAYDVLRTRSGSRAVGALVERIAPTEASGAGGPHG